MDDVFQILIDRLKNGQTQKIKESFSPDFLDVSEKELQFLDPVEVSGEAYLSDQELILHFCIATKGFMPCVICNKMASFNLSIPNFYHAVPLQEIPGAIFDFRSSLREALLLELPQYTECNQGKCPEREIIAPYLKDETKNKKHHTYFPFSNLDS